MNSLLKNVENDLRHVVKKHKNISFSIGLVLLYLMLGLNAFSTEENIKERFEEPTNKIKKENIKASTDKLTEVLKDIRAQKEKKLKKNQLELIKLIEQGEQVVKSPWSSWQFGMNYTYENWAETYKGKADKKNLEKFLRDKNQNFLKRHLNTYKNYTDYDLVDIIVLNEKPARIKIGATIKAKLFSRDISVKEIKRNYINYVDVKEIITSPVVKPEVKEPKSITPPEVSFSGNWINGAAGVYADWIGPKNLVATDGHLYQTSAESGSILKKRGKTHKVYLKDYEKGKVRLNKKINKGTEPPRDIEDGLENDVSFFLSLDDIAYTYTGKDFKGAYIGEGDWLPNFIHFETEGRTEYSFEKLRDEAYITEEVLKDLRRYTLDTKFDSYAKDPELYKSGNGEFYHVNKGTVELGGERTRYVQTTYNGGNHGRVNVVENRGDIISMNFEEGDIKTLKNVIYLHSPDTPGTGQHIYANAKDGKIEIYGEKGIVAAYTADGSQLSQVGVSFYNDGEVNLYGRENTGIYIAGDEKGLLREDANFILNKPVKIYGDSSTGLYVKNSGPGTRNPINTVRFVIGDKNPNSIPAYIPKNYFLKQENSLAPKHNKDGNDPNYTEESIGIFLDGEEKNGKEDLQIKIPQLDIEKFSKASVGAYAKEGRINITEGLIRIKGGEDNIALFADNKQEYIYYFEEPEEGIGEYEDIYIEAANYNPSIEKSKIEFARKIILSVSKNTEDGGNSLGRGNIGIFSRRREIVNMDGEFYSYDEDGISRDGIGAFSDGGYINLRGKVDLKFKAGETGNSVGLYAKNYGNILLSYKDPLEDENKRFLDASIFIDGEKDDGTITNKGVGVFAENSSILINANNLQEGLKIRMKNASSAIGSIKNSNVSLNYSTIDYDGNAYVLYSKDGGLINVNDSVINLYGKAILFEKDVKIVDSPIKVNNTRVNVFSNDVTIMDLKNMENLKLSTLGEQLKDLTGGIEHIAGKKDGVVFDKYKIARTEGITDYSVDVNLDKSKAVELVDKDTNDYQFSRRLRVQRSIMNVKPEVEVKAVLSKDDLDKMGEKNLLGLSMTSSKNALSNSESQINMAKGAIIKADQKSPDIAGAIGLYVNYGKIDIEKGSKILVEKEDANANKNAVGAYIVNGSEIVNKGEIGVGGTESIGILALSYRKDEKGKLVENEFGALALEQGKFLVKNDGKIFTDGEFAVAIYGENNNRIADEKKAQVFNNEDGLIEVSGKNSIALLGKRTAIFNLGNIKVNSPEAGIAMFAKSGKYWDGIEEKDLKFEVQNGGFIELAKSNSKEKPNIAMYTDDKNITLVNKKKIEANTNNYAMYGYDIKTGKDSVIKVGNHGVAIFSLGNKVDLEEGSLIDAKAEDSVGFILKANNSTVNSSSNIKMGDSSFAYVVNGENNVLNVNYTGSIELTNNATYIYSTDRGAEIINKTKLNSRGSRNYGVYASGTVTNLADIDFSNGNGNVALYANQNGHIKNGLLVGEKPIIRVGRSVSEEGIYSMGMAAGYMDDKTKEIKHTGIVENYGNIIVEGEGGIAMYAVGKGSKAINRKGAIIELDAKDSIGMLLDQNAIGENYGTIRTKPDSTKTGMIGVAILNGAVMKNYGEIIIEGEGNQAIYRSKAEMPNPEGKITLKNGARKVFFKDSTETSKELRGVKILVPKGVEKAEIYVYDKKVEPISIDTLIAEPDTKEIRVGKDIKDINRVFDFDYKSSSKISNLGMYVDTSGINYTKPIKGIEYLTNLKEIDLVFGVEASKYTNDKKIEIGNNILKPYNSVMKKVNDLGSEKEWLINSASLTWIATGLQDSQEGTLKFAYMAKIPYPSFAKKGDTNLLNFTDGLEQRYGVESINSREKMLFEKLNSIGKGEPRILAQAFDEMMGHQYANIQQRIHSTGRILDKEFDYLKDEWRTASKDSNKIKVFGMKGEYSTDTAGVIDYKNNAYGVAYVGENETIKLGKTSGWYTGLVHNKFDFKDIGNSKEEMLQAKLGLFKTTAFDDNGSLNWTISGEIFAGYNKMNRRFLVVDEIFNARSRYWSYGAALKNELSKSFRLSEDFSLRGYGSIKAEYGKFQKIKEKSGEIRLEIKSNDYISVKPEIGGELVYKTPLSGRNFFNAKLGIAYENELGKIGEAKNKARVAHTNADWFNIRGEKEDRRGNVRTDLSLGWDNEQFGVTVNLGYDKKGNNRRAGLGMRVIF